MQLKFSVSHGSLTFYRIRLIDGILNKNINTNLLLLLFLSLQPTQLQTVPPSVVSVPSGRIEAKLGSVFEIICEAQGIPHPIISWRHHGQSNSTQLENMRTKVIEVNDRGMAGNIECVATNGVGQPAVAGVDLVVLCKSF